MNKIFPTLYKRTSTGKIREWIIEVEANKFRVITGDQGFKSTTSDWTICKHKNLGKANEISSIDQAMKEAQARWDKQLKSEGYHEDVKNIDQKKFIKPMLAKSLADYKDRIDPAEGLILEVKFNGMRAVATKDGLHTRTGEKYLTVPHIESALKGFFEQYPDAVLDGELFNMDLREQLNEIAKLIRRTVHITPEHLKVSKEKVKFYCYDGYGGPFGKAAVPYKERKAIIDSWLPKFNYCVQVRDYEADSWEAVDEIYQGFLEDRHEGAIIRFPNSPYENKRSKFLLKLKPEDDSEFKITNIQEGKGNWSGKAKIISLEMPDGRMFDATFKGSMPDAEQCLKDRDKWIGKTVTIKYNGLTGLGKGCPQFAQFDYRNSLKGDR